MPVSFPRFCLQRGHLLQVVEVRLNVPNSRYPCAPSVLALWRWRTFFRFPGGSSTKLGVDHKSFVTRISKDAGSDVPVHEPGILPSRWSKGIPSSALYWFQQAVFVPTPFPGLAAVSAQTPMIHPSYPVMESTIAFLQEGELPSTPRRTSRGLGLIRAPFFQKDPASAFVEIRISG